jgi:hypothetical protein
MVFGFWFFFGRNLARRGAFSLGASSMYIVFPLCLYKFEEEENAYF